MVRKRTLRLTSLALILLGAWLVLRAQEPAGADHEFDQGSDVQISGLTPLQTQNLAMLGRVWGFLKYHHPVVTAGKRNWDYELFRIMPGVIRARSRSELNALLVDWIDGLGAVEACATCNSLDQTGLKLKPDLEWVSDADLLSTSLSQRLLTIYRSRVRNQQFYVSLAPNVGNPSFPHEPDYPDVKLPDAGYQLLGLFRLWNVIEYWYPYRDVMGEKWTDVLTEFIPRAALAGDREAYARAMLTMTTMIHDSHSNGLVAAGIRPPFGDCRLPVNLRMVDGRALVTGYSKDDTGKASGLRVGDEIAALDGVPVSEMVKDWIPIYAASNDTVRSRTIMNLLTNGQCGPVKVNVKRGDAAITLSATRLRLAEAGAQSWTHDLPGPAFRMLTPEIAYVKLSMLKKEDVVIDLLVALETKGLIVDDRNYPQGTAFELGSRLVEKSTEFAIFSVADMSNPGAFHTAPTQAVLTPAEPHYAGKVVILVDEETMSQAEYTAMALRAAPNAIVVGSMTAGADGNVSRIPLPGGLQSLISGVGVYYPDGSPTQRVGIHVDVEARPTIEGIRAGRDEVLERAIREIEPELSESDVEKLARAE
jgi:C-terminal processing protease CtpA/Prc